ncbi:MULTISPECIES: phosphotransferase family protein [Streptomyces]|uniref:phosphotransferase family protein n=1 Tax=Streptomyces TaxID=1883 RepID=UPI0016748ACE|nr:MULTISPECIES: phosphotransferase [Streptomyces]MBD3575925.1 phosphotransferase [Streptomyces sp. KD18]
MAAYRTWVPARGPSAPRLVVADTTAQPVVVSALTGRPLHGMALAPAAEALVRHALGRLARTLHTSAPEQPAGTGSPAGKLQRHLKAARPHLAAAEEELIPALARTYADLPQPALVPTHGDLQDRNVSLTDAGEPRLFDFERSGSPRPPGTWCT